MTAGLGRMGATAARRRPGQWVRGVVLALGAGVLTLGLIGLALAAARTSGSQTRSFAAGPVAASAGERPHLWWVRLPHGAVQDHPVTVIGLFGGGGTLVPPGVTHLPGVGEAVLSERLRADLGAAHDRYGRDVGSIDSGTLETPTERRVYVGLDHRPPDAVPVIRFGAVDSPMTGLLYQPPLSSVQLVVLLSLVLPGAATLVIGSRTGSAARASLDRLVTYTGAGLRSRLALTIGAELTPVAFGAAAAALLGTFALGRDIEVPLTRTVLSHHDARTVAWAWPVAGALATLTGLAACATGRSDARTERRRWTSLPTGALAILAALFLLLIRPVLGRVPGTWALLVFLAMIVICAALLPFLVGWILARAGATIAPLAYRFGSPGTLVAGRQLTAHQERVAAMTAPAIVATAVLTLATLWGGVLSGQAAAANRSLALAQGRLAQLELVGDPTPGLVHLLRRPAPGAGALVITRGGTNDTVRGDCLALTGVGLACTPGQQTPDLHNGVARALQGWVTSAVTVQVGPVDDAVLHRSPSTVYIVAPKALDMDGLTRALLAAAPETASVELVGQNWTVASSPSATAAGWLLVLGSTAVTTLVLAFGLGAADRLAEQVRASTAVLRWSDRCAPMLALAFWRGTLPYLVGFATAAGLAVWAAAIVHERDTRFVLPSALVPAILCVGGTVSVILGIAAYLSMRSDR